MSEQDAANGAAAVPHRAPAARGSAGADAARVESEPGAPQGSPHTPVHAATVEFLTYAAIARAFACRYDLATWGLAEAAEWVDQRRHRRGPQLRRAYRAHAARVDRALLARDLADDAWRALKAAAVRLDRARAVRDQALRYVTRAQRLGY